jgi:transposase
VWRCAAFRPTGEPSLIQIVKRTMRLLATRWLRLSEELCELNGTLAMLTARVAPSLLACHGIGPQTAATLLLTAGDNPQRLRREAALAALCGVSPLEASSGRIVRHRLNRGGDRQANNALWTIALTRMRGEPRTRAYVTKRTQEGRTLPEIRRCLKRYIAREIYPLLLADLAAAASVPWHRSVNAVMESFFSTVKFELGEHFESCGDAKMQLFDYVEVFYNQRRRHSTLGQISPAAFERRTAAA